jgi:hypothetical protein
VRALLRVFEQTNRSAVATEPALVWPKNQQAAKPKSSAAQQATARTQGGRNEANKTCASYTPLPSSVLVCSASLCVRRRSLRVPFCCSFACPLLCCCPSPRCAVPRARRPTAHTQHDQHANRADAQQHSHTTHLTAATGAAPLCCCLALSAPSLPAASSAAAARFLDRALCAVVECAGTAHWRCGEKRERGFFTPRLVLLRCAFVRSALGVEQLPRVSARAVLWPKLIHVCLYFCVVCSSQDACVTDTAIHRAYD